MFRVQIREEIGKLVPEGTVFSVERSESAEHGDYSSNVALVLAKKTENSPAGGPREIAEEIKNKIVPRLSSGRSALLGRIEIAGQGFLNFFIARTALTAALQGVLNDPYGWGKSGIGNGKTVIVEYFQLNVGKLPHIGHLRSAVIGDSIKRMLLAFGYKAISDTHVGDWGTQFGILIYAIKQFAQQSSFLQLDLYLQDPARQEGLYVLYNRSVEDENIRKQLIGMGMANENTDFNHIVDRGKEEFAKLEKGDDQNRKIWKMLSDVSMNHLKENAERLGLLEFEENKGESVYEAEMQPIVKDALAKGIAKNKDGAIIVDLNQYNLDDAILIKSDGASTYLLRDLATIKDRKENFNFYKNLYVVDVRQEHHFKQVFKVAELLGFEGVGESQHISYGFMSLPEGIISTRKGNIISLGSLLWDAEKKATDVIIEKNPDLENKKEVAKQVGIGALKYFDLSHNRHSDIVFRWDEALSFDGNTGPYLQYTHARFKSILRKLDEKIVARNKDIELDSVERELLVSILHFPEIIEDALSDFMPNILANYLFKLAQLANNFYHSHPVIQEDDENKKQIRIALIKAFAETLKNSLYLLGIDAPEKM